MRLDDASPRTRVLLVAVAVTAVIVAAALVGTSLFGVEPATDASGGQTPGSATGVPPGDESTNRPGTVTSSPDQFAFAIQRIESCGETCRDVTASLTNVGTETASNVTVEVTMSVQNDRIWEGTSRLGTLEPGETTTDTKRVEIGLFDGAKIQQNGGYVTIETTVVWDGGSTTFTQRRNVT